MSVVTMREITETMAQLLPWVYSWCVQVAVCFVFTIDAICFVTTRWIIVLILKNSFRYVQSIASLSWIAQSFYFFLSNFQNMFLMKCSRSANYLKTNGLWNASKHNLWRMIAPWNPNSVLENMLSEAMERNTNT